MLVDPVAFPDTTETRHTSRGHVARKSERCDREFQQSVPLLRPVPSLHYKADISMDGSTLKYLSEGGREPTERGLRVARFTSHVIQAYSYLSVATGKRRLR